MMRAIQVCLRRRIGLFSGGLLMFVFVVPGVGRLGFGGLMTAILCHSRKRRLQRKHAKQKDEQQAIHLATESNINAVYRKTSGSMRATDLPRLSQAQKEKQSAISAIAAATKTNGAALS